MTSRRTAGRADGRRPTPKGRASPAHKSAGGLDPTEERLQAVIRNAPIVLFAIDGEGIFTLSDGKGLEAFGGTPGEAVGVSVFEMYKDAPQVLANIRRALAGETFTATTAVGDLVYETYYRPSFDDAGRVTSVVGVATDITERIRAIEFLTEQARRDPLTGALNHGAITDHLAQALAASRRLAVAMVDVDGMKAVNDTYGHLSGDAVLRTVAGALEEDGAVVGRYGGDEFLVVISEADRNRARAYVDGADVRIRDAMVRDAETSATIRLPVSIGFAVHPDEAGTLVDLIKVADNAMYAAKSKRALEDGEVARRMDDRVSAMIGDLVPLLTSPGGLDEKLRLVGARLSTGTGYDAVDCQIFRSRGPSAQSALHEGTTDELTERWRAEQRSGTDGMQRPINQILAKTRRPVILEDLPSDERLTPPERKVLAQAGLQSAIVAPMLWDGQLIGTVAVARKRKAAFAPRDAQFLAAIANQVTAIVKMATLVDGLQSATERLSEAQAQTVVMLAAAAEAHDATTGHHLASIRLLAEALAAEMGYDHDAVQELGLAATLHDIGKIRVPDSILSSPVRFDTDDWEVARVWDVMKQHSVWGAEFLAGRDEFALAAKVARWHHERWDGKGYPDGLSGAQIPEQVAIVTVADAFDAMVHDRPYRAARPIAEAVNEIVRCRGDQFSPAVVDALVRLHHDGTLPGPLAEEQLAA
ncbi:MAG TPA: diguanylate cyclase [Dehalococcoidia bacterium]|nr:diguanylate cyclase [Dehalococcoidia bacterium]